MMTAMSMSILEPSSSELRDCIEGERVSDLGTMRLQEEVLSLPWASAVSKEGGGSVGMPFVI